MPIAVLRSLTGMMSSAIRLARRSPRGLRITRLGSGGGVAPGEALEPRQLFAIAIAPVAAGASATTLGASLLVPNTGLTITGGTYVGANDQGGTFTGFDLSPTGQLTLQDGVLLSTGLANNALPPNDAPNTTTALNTPGDADLNALTGLTTVDANSLTLTFTAVPGTQSIMFDFVFGSEQFAEFVGAFFNDTFAAYLDGTQISFDLSGEPFSIRNGFFAVDNLNGNFEVEYDGLTPRLRTRAPLNMLPTHTLKFVIGDAVNATFDSGVFLSRLQGSAVAAGSASLTEVPQTGEVEFASAAYSIEEGAGTATILVNRVGGTSGQVSVNYAVTAGTATDLLDFTAVTGTLFFADGQVSQTFTFPILQDALTEGDETVQMTLSAPADTNLGTSSVVTLSILDDERALYFEPKVYVIDETAGTVTLTVARSGLLTGIATINYATSDGADPLNFTLPSGLTGPVNPATQNADYLPRSGTIVFAEGQRTQTITVPIVGDFVDIESALEGFTVTLSNPAGSAAPIGVGVQGSAVVIIQNVDRPPSVFDITAFAPAGRIEALYLQVQDPLQADRVLDPSNYRLFQHAERRFNAQGARKRVAISTVQYSADLKTITIRPKNVLKNNVFYEVAIRGNFESGVISTTNEPLDGNFDRIAGIDFTLGDDFVGYFGRGTRLQYFDRDGDRVLLGAAGGGVIEVFRDITRNARQVRYLGAVPSASAVYGSITPARRSSDRVTVIDTLLLNGAMNFLGTPFNVTYLIPA